MSAAYAVLEGGQGLYGHRIGSLLLAVVLAGCGVPAPPTTPGTTSEAPQATPTVVVVPSPTQFDPCRPVVVRLGDFTKRMAEALAALRPLIVATSFDAARTLGSVRRVSTLIEFDAGLEDALGTCAATASLQARIGVLNDKVAARVATSLKAAFNRRSQRGAAVTLWRLLPSVLSLAAETETIGSGQGVAIAPPELLEDATNPLGKLPKIQ